MRSIKGLTDLLVGIALQYVVYPEAKNIAENTIEALKHEGNLCLHPVISGVWFSGEDEPERSSSMEIKKVLVKYEDHEGVCVKFGHLTSFGQWRIEGSNSDVTGNIRGWMPLPEVDHA